MIYSIRPWAEDDRDDVVRFITDIQQREFELAISVRDQPDLLDVRSSYQAGDGEFWVARHAGAVAGTIAAIRIGDDDIALRKLFVSGRHRGREKGLAPKLMDALLAWAGREHVRDIYLGTTAVMHAAHRFYAKHGFSEIARDDLAAAFPVMLVDSRFYRRRL